MATTTTADGASSSTTTSTTLIDRTTSADSSTTGTGNYTHVTGGIGGTYQPVGTTSYVTSRGPDTCPFDRRMNNAEPDEPITWARRGHDDPVIVGNYVG